MKLNHPIQVRLTPKTQARLEAAARAQGVPVSAIIRERLERAEGIEAALTGLRADMALSQSRTRQTTPEAPPHSPILEGMLAELLLLFRNANQERSRQVQPEVARLGLPVWRG